MLAGHPQAEQLGRRGREVVVCLAGVRSREVRGADDQIDRLLDARGNGVVRAAGALVLVLAVMLLRLLVDELAAGQEVLRVGPFPEEVAELRNQGHRDHAEQQHDRQGWQRELPGTADDRGPPGVEDAGDHGEHQQADQGRYPEERAEDDGERPAMVAVRGALEGEEPDDREGREAGEEEFLPVGREGGRSGAHVRIT